jgi:hypothetical protein
MRLRITARGENRNIIAHRGYGQELTRLEVERSYTIYTLVTEAKAGNERQRYGAPFAPRVSQDQTRRQVGDCDWDSG